MSPQGGAAPQQQRVNIYDVLAEPLQGTSLGCVHTQKNRALCCALAATYTSLFSLSLSTTHCAVVFTLRRLRIPATALRKR
jgi:hypothetical protein